MQGNSFIHGILLSKWAGLLSELFVSLGYLGAFIAPLLGVFTYYLLPWPLIIFTLGGLINPIAVALLAASGAALGESLYYFVGSGISRILPEKLNLYVKKGKVYLEKYGPVAVFFFALTPLPDEVIWIPIGMLNYDKRKALISCWLGKFLLTAAIAFAGYYGLNYLRDFFT
jgi:membrane protein DedA with SNARE-associated domain